MMTGPKSLGGLKFNYGNAALVSPSTRRSHRSNINGSEDMGSPSYVNDNNNNSKVQRSNSHKIIVDDNDLENLFQKARIFEDEKSVFQPGDQNTLDREHNISGGELDIDNESQYHGHNGEDIFASGFDSIDEEMLFEEHIYDEECIDHSSIENIIKQQHEMHNNGKNVSRNSSFASIQSRQGSFSKPNKESSLSRNQSQYNDLRSNLRRHNTFNSNQSRLNSFKDDQSRHNSFNGNTEWPRESRIRRSFSNVKPRSKYLTEQNQREFHFVESSPTDMTNSKMNVDFPQDGSDSNMEAYQASVTGELESMYLTKQKSGFQINDISPAASRSSSGAENGSSQYLANRKYSVEQIDEAHASVVGELRSRYLTEQNQTNDISPAVSRSSSRAENGSSQYLANRKYSAEQIDEAHASVVGELRSRYLTEQNQTNDISPEVSRSSSRAENGSSQYLANRKYSVEQIDEAHASVVGELRSRYLTEQNQTNDISPAVSRSSSRAENGSSQYLANRKYSAEQIDEVHASVVSDLRSMYLTEQSEFHPRSSSVSINRSNSREKQSRPNSAYLKHRCFDVYNNNDNTQSGDNEQSGNNEHIGNVQEDIKKNRFTEEKEKTKDLENRRCFSDWDARLNNTDALEPVEEPYVRRVSWNEKQSYSNMSFQGIKNTESEKDEKSIIIDATSKCSFLSYSAPKSSKKSLNDVAARKARFDSGVTSAARYERTSPNERRAQNNFDLNKIVSSKFRLDQRQNFSIGDSLISRDQGRHKNNNAINSEVKRASSVIEISNSRGLTSSISSTTNDGDVYQMKKVDFLSLENVDTGQVKRSVSFNEQLNSRHEYDDPEYIIQSSIDVKANLRTGELNYSKDMMKNISSTKNYMNDQKRFTFTNHFEKFENKITVQSNGNKVKENKEKQQQHRYQHQQQQRQQQQQQQQGLQQEKRHELQWDKRNLNKVPLHSKTNTKTKTDRKRMEFTSTGYGIKNHRNFASESSVHSFDDGYETGRTSVSSGSEITSSSSDLFFPAENGMDHHHEFGTATSAAVKGLYSSTHKPRSLSNLHEILNLEAKEDERTQDEMNQDLKDGDEELVESRKNIHNKLENILKARVKSINSKGQQKREMRFPDPLLVNEPPLIIEQNQQQQQQQFLSSQSENVSSKPDQSEERYDNRNASTESMLSYQQQQELFLSTITAKKSFYSNLENQSHDEMVNQSYHSVSNNNQSEMLHERRSPDPSHHISTSALRDGHSPIDASYNSRPPVDASYTGRPFVDASYRGVASAHSSRRPSVSQLTLGKESGVVDKKESMLNELRHTMIRKGLSRPASPTEDDSFYGTDSVEGLYATVNKFSKETGQQSNMTLGEPYSENMPDSHQFHQGPTEMYGFEKHDHNHNGDGAIPVNHDNGNERLTGENPINRNAVMDMLKMKNGNGSIRENEQKGVRPKVKTNAFSFISNDIESEFPETFEPLNGDPSSLQRRLSVESFKPELEILSSASFKRNARPAKYQISEQSNDPIKTSTVADTFEVPMNDSPIQTQMSNDFYSKVQEFKSPIPSRKAMNVERHQDLEISVRKRANTFSDTKETDIKRNSVSVNESSSNIFRRESQIRLQNQSEAVRFRRRSKSPDSRIVTSSKDVTIRPRDHIEPQLVGSRTNSLHNLNEQNCQSNESRPTKMEIEPLELRSRSNSLEPPEEMQPDVHSLDIPNDNQADAAFNPRRRSSPMLLRSNRGKNLYQTEYYNPADNGESLIKPSEFQVHRFYDRKKIQLDTVIPAPPRENTKITVQPNPTLDMKLSLSDLKRERNLQRQKLTKRFSTSEPFLASMNSDSKKPENENQPNLTRSGFDSAKLTGDTLSKKSARKKIEKWSNETYTHTNVGKVSIPDHFQGSKPTDFIDERKKKNDDTFQLRKHKRDHVSENSSTTSSPRASTAKKTRRFSLTSLSSGMTSARSDITTSTTVPSSPSIGRRFKQLFSPRSKRKGGKQKDGNNEEIDEDIVRRLNMNSSTAATPRSQFGDDIVPSFSSLNSMSNNNNGRMLNVQPADEEDESFGLDDSFLSTEEWLRQNGDNVSNGNSKHKPVIKQSLVPVNSAENRSNPDLNSWKTRKSFIGKVVVPDVFSDRVGNNIIESTDQSGNYNGPVIYGSRKMSSGRMFRSGEIITNSDAVINSFDVDH